MRGSRKRSVILQTGYSPGSLLRKGKVSTQSEVKAQRKQQAARILTQLRQTLPSALAKYPVDAAYVYGSVARGAVTPLSDVDIALVLSESLSPYDRLMIEFAIQAAIEDASGLRAVDVRAINEAPLLVRGKVVQQGILLYQRDRARRAAFEVQTRKRYFDFAPVARRLCTAFLSNVHREGLLRGRS
jgi:predicted nucleotidyltransferase